MHERREIQSLEIHRRIAGLLISDPSRVLAKATANLNAWLKSRNASASGSAHREWLSILQTLSAQEIASLIVSNDEQATRLRQSSPFVGILSPQEIWSIKRSHATA
jgi:hypothetical protein